MKPISTQEQRDEHRKRLNAFNLTLMWDVRCWNCGTTNQAKLDELHQPCKHCGVMLDKRD